MGMGSDFFFDCKGIKSDCSCDRRGRGNGCFAGCWVSRFFVDGRGGGNVRSVYCRGRVSVIVIGSQSGDGGLRRTCLVVVGVCGDRGGLSGYYCELLSAKLKTDTKPVPEFSLMDIQCRGSRYQKFPPQGHLHHRQTPHPNNAPITPPPLHPSSFPHYSRLQRLHRLPPSLPALPTPPQHPPTPPPYSPIHHPPNGLHLHLPRQPSRFPPSAPPSDNFPSILSYRRVLVRGFVCCV